VSLLRERKKRVGEAGQECWVQEYMSTIVQIDWSARWKVVLWLSWLRWCSRVDLEEKCRLGPVREWLQPGIGVCG